MIPIPAGVRVWLASGHTDMRQGLNGLALLVEEKLRRDPYGGHLFVFRGPAWGIDQGFVARRPGLCLYAKRPERGRFLWPSPAHGTVAITPVRLGYLLEGTENSQRRKQRLDAHFKLGRSLGSGAR
jgi:transposase